MRCVQSYLLLNAPDEIIFKTPLLRMHSHYTTLCSMLMLLILRLLTVMTNDEYQSWYMVYGIDIDSCIFCFESKSINQPIDIFNTLLQSLLSRSCIIVANRCFIQEEIGPYSTCPSLVTC